MYDGCEGNAAPSLSAVTRKCGAHRRIVLHQQALPLVRPKHSQEVGTCRVRMGQAWGTRSRRGWAGAARQKGGTAQILSCTQCTEPQCASPHTPLLLRRRTRGAAGVQALPKEAPHGGAGRGVVF